MTNSEQAIREFAEKWGFSQDKTDEGFLIDNDRTKQCLSDLTALIEEHYVSREEHEKLVEDYQRLLEQYDSLIDCDDEDGITTYHKAVQLRKEGLDNRNIALRLGKNESVISRYLQDGFVPFETKARYFSDFIRTKEWFYEL